MATETTFFGLFQKLIQILIAWSIISNLVFHHFFDLAISFIPIQLGSLGSLNITKSLLQGSHFWIPVLPVFYSLNCNSDIKTEEGSLIDEIASYQNLYQLLTYLQKCCHKVVDPEGALKCAWSKKSFLWHFLGV